VVDFFKSEVIVGQGPFNRADRKLTVVLDAAEPFLLGREQDLTVADKAGGAIMIEGRYPENVNGRLPIR